MTITETKEWLNRARTIDQELSALLDARDIALSRCLAVTPRSQKIKVSEQPEPRCEPSRVAYLRLQDAIDDKIDKLCNIKHEVFNTIQAIRDDVCRTLLIERYINCKTLEQVAEAMNYSYMQICRLHDKALGQIML